MDEEMPALMRGVYGFLQNHKQMTTEVMIVTDVLRKTIFQLGPEAARIH